MDCHLAMREVSVALLASLSMAYCIWISCGRLFHVWNSLAFCSMQGHQNKTQRSSSMKNHPEAGSIQSIPSIASWCDDSQA